MQLQGSRETLLNSTGRSKMGMGLFSVWQPRIPSVPWLLEGLADTSWTLWG